MFAKRDGHFKHIPRFCANCVSLKPSNGSKGDGRLQSGASALWTLEVLYMIPIIEIKEELFVEKITSKGIELLYSYEFVFVRVFDIGQEKKF